MDDRETRMTMLCNLVVLSRPVGNLWGQYDVLSAQGRIAQTVC